MLRVCAPAHEASMRQLLLDGRVTFGSALERLHTSGNPDKASGFQDFRGPTRPAHANQLWTS